MAFKKTKLFQKRVNNRGSDVRVPWVLESPADLVFLSVREDPGVEKENEGEHHRGGNQKGQVLKVQRIFKVC